MFQFPVFKQFIATDWYTTDKQIPTIELCTVPLYKTRETCK